jgi:hypothetical protein
MQKESGKPDYFLSKSEKFTDEVESAFWLKWKGKTNAWYEKAKQEYYEIESCSPLFAFGSINFVKYLAHLMRQTKN